MMVLLEFIVTVVFMALALATLPFQLFQVLQLVLNEAFTVIVVLHGMLFQVFCVPPGTVPYPTTLTLQQLAVWSTVRLRTQVQLAVMDWFELMVTVVFMALALATPPVQLFQVLQLALNEAFTWITVPHEML